MRLLESHVSRSARELRESRDEVAGLNSTIAQLLEGSSSPRPQRSRRQSGSYKAVDGYLDVARDEAAAMFRSSVSDLAARFCAGRSPSSASLARRESLNATTAPGGSTSTIKRGHASTSHLDSGAEGASEEQSEAEAEGNEKFNFPVAVDEVSTAESSVNLHSALCVDPAGMRSTCSAGRALQGKRLKTDRGAFVYRSSLSLRTQSLLIWNQMTQEKSRHYPGRLFPLSLVKPSRSCKAAKSSLRICAAIWRPPTAKPL